MKVKFDKYCDTGKFFKFLGSTNAIYKQLAWGLIFLDGSHQKDSSVLVDTIFLKFWAIM